MGRFSSERSDIETSPDKMGSIQHKENVSHNGMTADDVEFLATFSEEDRKRVVRKIDVRLMPILLLLYLMAYLDKTNIGNAKIEGILDDLHMSGIQYNIAVSIFFIPFVLAEVPSNIVLNKVPRPSWYMGTIVAIWGVVMTLTGIVHNYASLLAIRVLLGLFEAGFLPGAILIISKWYLPNETQTRIAILYTSAATGGAFSGLLAFAIAKMDGVAGLEGWRWIFILEGIGTVAIGVVAFMLLIDSPAQSKWLTPSETRYLILRQQARHTGKETSHFDAKALMEVFADWKIYLLILANWSNAVPNYALKFTMPQIIKNMGFTSSNAQLLTIPPYMCGAASSYIVSLFADRYSWRMPFILGPQLLVIISYGILFGKAAEIKDNIALCYFAVCVACIGMYPILPGVNAWNVANCPDPAKRAISIGFLVCIGNIGGLIGSYIYIEREAPKYPTGFGSSLGFAAAGVLAVIALEMILLRLNKQKEAFSEDEVREKYSEAELAAMAEKSPLFKYAL